MEIQTLTPRKTEYKVVRIGTNEYGRKYIEAVQVVSTDPVYSVSRLSVLEVAYFCSVILIGFYVGFNLFTQA